VAAEYLTILPYTARPIAVANTAGVGLRLDATLAGVAIADVGFLIPIGFLSLSVADVESFFSARFGVVVDPVDSRAGFMVFAAIEFFRIGCTVGQQTYSWPRRVLVARGGEGPAPAVMSAVVGGVVPSGFGS